ncbi:MAG: tetratricopeptide repeat protein [Candidatus Latescibacteria bacterium]|nr:tetratricopeptide repeat protein [Candidatus Latescibacterota bacterium]
MIYLRFTLVLLLLCPALVFAGEFHRVALLPFVYEGAGEDPSTGSGQALAWAGDGVAALVADRLAETGKVRLVDPSGVRWTRGEGGDAGDAARLRGIGRRLNVDLVAAGVCRREGEKLRIILYTMGVDLDLYRADEVTTDPEGLARASGKVTQKVLAAFQVRLLPARERRLFREGPKTREALHVYARAASAPSAEERLRLLEQLAQPEEAGPDVLVRLGDAYLAAGRIREAEAAYQRAAIQDPEHLLAANNLGVLRLREERYDEAVAQFRKVSDFAPGFADAWYNLGLAYQGLEADSTAAGAYARAMALDGAHLAARLNLGVLYARHGQFAEAVGHFEGVLRQDPGHLPARLNLASAFEKRGSPDSAAAIYEQVLSLKPEEKRARAGLIEARLVLAQRHLNQKQFAEAEAECRRAVALDSTHSRAHLGLSLALSARGDVEGGVREAERAAVLAPEDATAWLHLGNSYQVVRRADRAAEAYGEATRLDPGLEAAWRNLGAALIDAGRPSEAVASLRKALGLKPDATDAHANLGLACANQGDYEAAAKSYAQALALRPDDPELLLRLGYACALSARPDSAARAFERAAHLSLRPAEVWEKVGGFFERQRRPTDAIAGYRRAVEADPGLIDVRYRLGLLLNAAGERAAALVHLSEVARRDPGRREVWSALGALYSAQGDLLEATGAYERAAGVDPAHAAIHRYNAGLLHLKRRDAEAARRDLGMAVALEPDNALAHLMLARARSLTGHYGEAIDAYRKALALGFRPHDNVRVAAVRVELASVLKEARREDEAVEACRAVLKDDPGSAPAQSLLGDLYAGQSRYDLAVAAYEQALKSDPRRLSVYYALGRACQQRGDRAGAVRYLEQYLAQKPGASEADRVAAARAMLEALKR